MAEWKVIRIVLNRDMVMMQCPSCGTVTFFPRLALVTKYSVSEEKRTKPYVKCEECDFQPYLPLDLKSRSKIMVILGTKDKRVTFSPVYSTNPDEVRFDRYGPPDNILYATRSQTKQEDHNEAE